MNPKWISRLTTGALLLALSGVAAIKGQTRPAYLERPETATPAELVAAINAIGTVTSRRDGCTITRSVSSTAATFHYRETAQCGGGSGGRRSYSANYRDLDSHAMMLTMGAATLPCKDRRRCIALEGGTDNFAFLKNDPYLQLLLYHLAQKSI